MHHSPGRAHTREGGHGRRRNGTRRGRRRPQAAAAIDRHAELGDEEFDFWNDQYEGRRLFSELLGTFFLVLVAVGGGMVNARFGGEAVPYGALVVAPALMVAAIILFMGTVSGAHLNPAVSIAFAPAATSRGGGSRRTSWRSSSARCSPRCCSGR